MGWLFLFIASLCEVGWLYAIKFVDVRQLRSIGWKGFIEEPHNLKELLPVGGYVVFGIANIVFFSLAMKHIPAATAYAVWMAIALVVTKLIDRFCLQEQAPPLQLLWLGFILVGVIGLRATT